MSDNRATELEAKVDACERELKSARLSRVRWQHKANEMEWYCIRLTRLVRGMHAELDSMRDDVPLMDYIEKCMSELGIEVERCGMSFGDEKNGSLHERVSELEHMVQTRNESIHNLTKLLEKRQNRVEELEKESEKYTESYAQALAKGVFDYQRIKALEQLVRDMWVELCCSSSGFDVKKQVDELGERMNDLGIEVE